MKQKYQGNIKQNSTNSGCLSRPHMLVHCWRRLNSVVVPFGYCYRAVWFIQYRISHHTRYRRSMQSKNPIVLRRDDKCLNTNLRTPDPYDARLTGQLIIPTNLLMCRFDYCKPRFLLRVYWLTPHYTDPPRFFVCSFHWLGCLSFDCHLSFLRFPFISRIHSLFFLCFLDLFSVPHVFIPLNCTIEYSMVVLIIVKVVICVFSSK